MSEFNSSPGDEASVRDLRARWKPHKLRRPNSPTSIRIHRACSWLERGEELVEAGDPDLALVSNWIGLNALYGQWDVDLRQPLPDQETLYGFFERVFALDREERVAQVLRDQRPLVLDVLGDPFLSRHFWDDPDPKRAKKVSPDQFDARKWSLLCSRVVRRLYLLRCQLIHGAATRGGRLNRTAVAKGNRLLALLTKAAIAAIADHGGDEDWGAMCYPPLS